MSLIKILNRLTKTTQTASRKESRFSTRLLKVESLEERQLLSVNTGELTSAPPDFVGVVSDDIFDNQNISATANSLNNAILPTGNTHVVTTSIGNGSLADAITIAQTNESPSTRVTTLDDVVDESDGIISLREAITYAQSDETISFDSSLADGTISLSSVLAISKAITIDGSECPDLIISTADEYDGRHFTVSTTEDVTIKNLQLSNGTEYSGTGGSILKTGSGTLTLESVTFTDNAAKYGGAVGNGPSSTVIVTDCIFSQNSANADDLSAGGYGGAIYNSGTMTINGGKFSSNYALYGGAISNDALLTINYGTDDSVFFQKNHAKVNGGAIYNGYAVKNESISRKGELIINANESEKPTAIFKDNSSASNGGAISNFAKATIYSAEFTYNDFYTEERDVQAFKGGAIYNGAQISVDSDFTLTLCNDILFEYNGMNQTNILGGAIFNFFDSSICVSNSKFVKNGSFKTGSTGGAICNFGTIEMSGGNKFDENSAVKGGAIFNSGKSLLITGSNSFTNNQSSGYGGAICNSYIKYGDELLHGSLTITGSAECKIEFTDNSSTYSAGAIGNWGTATITHATFENNSAVNNGGAIFNDLYYSVSIDIVDKSSLSISNVTFKNNTARMGGAICTAPISRTNEITIEASTFTSNTAKQNGGAILSAGSVTLDTCEFTQNSARYNGGAIFNSGSLTLTNINTFATNSADVNGGAINNAIVGSRTGQLIIGDANVVMKTKFTENSAKGNGGAISNWGNAIIYNAIFEQSKASGSEALAKGGAIFNSNAITETKLVLYSCTFTFNFAQYGGAVFNQFDGFATITDCEFTSNGFIGENLLAYGGAVYNLGTLSCDSTFEWNKGINGGAILNGGTLMINVPIFRNNFASAYGGAIHNTLIITQDAEGQDVTYLGCLSIAQTQTQPDDPSQHVFEDNKATYGGAISNAGTAQINFTFFGSNSASKGGAIYNYHLETNPLNSANLSIHSVTEFASNLSYYGGALYNETNAWVSINNVVFNKNKANVSPSKYATDSGRGGAIYNLGKVDTESSVYFMSNFATAGGGAILNSGNLSLSETILESNRTAKNGGAIQNTVSGILSANENTKFNSNTARENGGAIDNCGLATIDDATFSENIADYNGGAIFNAQDSENHQTMTLTTSSFIDNRAGFGGGVANIGTLIVDGCSFKANCAENNILGGPANGGAITSGSLTTLEDGATPTASLTFNGGYTKLEANVADDLGGGLVLMADTACIISHGLYDENDDNSVGTLLFSGNKSLRHGITSENANALSYITPVDENNNPVNIPGIILDETTNIVLSMGTTKRIMSTGFNNPEYAFDADGDGVFEVKTKSILEANSLGLNVGTHKVSMSILVNNEVQITYFTTITIEANPVTLTSTKESFLNDQLVKMSFNLDTDCPIISQWVVNWGDNEESIVDAGTRSFTALHLYAAGDADQTNPITLSFIDVNGVRNTQPYLVTSHIVPAFGSSDDISILCLVDEALSSELPFVSGGEDAAAFEIGASPSVLPAPLDVEDFIDYENTYNNQNPPKPTFEVAETQDALIDAYWQTFEDESEKTDFSFDFGDEDTTDQGEDSNIDELLLEAIF